MSKLIPVKGEKNLFRDSETNAIINVSNHDYQSYIDMKNKKKNEIFKIDKIEEDLNYLKNDILEIKTLLGRILNEPR